MKFWLLGAGSMAAAYARVLKALRVNFEVVGRGEKSAAAFETKMGIPVIRGGAAAALRISKPQAAIVAVGVEDLASTACLLLRSGVKRLLVEKPAGLSLKEMAPLKEGRVLVAYNRRFYASVRKAQEMIEADGGVLSFHFEFTEWSHQIVDSSYSPKIKKRWLLANSSHVLDLAFFLGGEPSALSSYRGGALPWHPSGAIFSGAGRTKKGALFSYQANWKAPGRWGVELMTRSRRLVLRPLEKLFVQKHGSLELLAEPLDDKLDQDFKPGLYRQTKAFLENPSGMLDIQTHARRLAQWRRIGGEF